MPSSALPSSPEVLVVEDDSSSRGALVRWLARRGWLVHAAATGRSALRVARRVKPSLLLCDWDLGEGPDGLAVSEQLASEVPGLRVVLMTGGSPGTLRRCSRHVPGLAAVLGKPLAPEALHALEDVLATHASPARC